MTGKFVFASLDGGVLEEGKGPCRSLALVWIAPRELPSGHPSLREGRSLRIPHARINLNQLRSGPFMAPVARHTLSVGAVAHFGP